VLHCDITVVLCTIIDVIMIFNSSFLCFTVVLNYYISSSRVCSMFGCFMPPHKDRYIYIYILRQNCCQIQGCELWPVPSLAALTRYRLSLMTRKKSCWKSASTLVDEAISSPAVQQQIKLNCWHTNTLCQVIIYYCPWYKLLCDIPCHW